MHGIVFVTERQGVHSLARMLRGLPDLAEKATMHTFTGHPAKTKMQLMAEGAEAGKCNINHKIIIMVTLAVMAEGPEAGDRVRLVMLHQGMPRKLFLRPFPDAETMQGSQPLFLFCLHVAPSLQFLSHGVCQVKGKQSWQAARFEAACCTWCAQQSTSALTVLHRLS